MSTAIDWLALERQARQHRGTALDAAAARLRGAGGGEAS